MLFQQKGVFKNPMLLHDLIAYLRDGLSIDETIHMLTYEMAMKYYVLAAPESPKPKKGILMRENLSNKIRIIQAFMDEEDEVISKPGNEKLAYGRQLLVDSLDEELTELFGDASVIIVE